MIRSLGLTTLLSITLCAADAAPLSDRLISADRKVVTTALLDLARSGPSVAADIERARTYLGDPDPMVRQAAISAVTSLHDDAAVPMLAQVMRGHDETAKVNAHDALVALAGSDIGGKDPEAWRIWDASVVENTSKSVKAIQAALDANNPDKAREALHPLLMQRVGRDMVVDVLAEAAGNKDPQIARLAREGLSAIDSAYARITLDAVKARLADQAGEAVAGSEAARPGQAATARPTATPTALTGAGPLGERTSSAFVVVIAVAVAALLGVLVWRFRRTPADAAGKKDWTRVFILKKKPRK